MTPHAPQHATNPLLPIIDLLQPLPPLLPTLTYNADATKNHTLVILALQNATSSLKAHESMTVHFSQLTSTILSSPNHATKREAASELLDSFVAQRKLVAEIQDAAIQSQLYQHRYQEKETPVLEEEIFHAKMQDLTTLKLRLLAGDVAITQNRLRIAQRILAICNEHQHSLEAATSHVTEFLFWDILYYKNDIERGETQQDCFRKELIAYYESRREEDPNQAHPRRNEEYLWCPITKRFFQERYLVTVRFVPSQIKDETVGNIFGQLPGEGQGNLLMWSVENGMLMTREMEEGFREGVFVLVPVQTPGEPDGWRVILIDEGMRHEMANPSQTWDELDRVELKFRNENRPGRAFLYFSYCMAIWRMIREKRGQEWVALKERIVRHELWTLPGRYLRTSMLRDLAALIGGEVTLPEVLLEGGDMKLEGEVPLEIVKDLASALLNTAEFDADGWKERLDD